jgi:hypothetical protein
MISSQRDPLSNQEGILYGNIMYSSVTVWSRILLVWNFHAERILPVPCLACSPTRSLSRRPSTYRIIKVLLYLNNSTQIKFQNVERVLMAFIKKNEKDIRNQTMNDITLSSHQKFNSHVPRGVHIWTISQATWRRGSFQLGVYCASELQQRVRDNLDIWTAISASILFS